MAAKQYEVVAACQNMKHLIEQIHEKLKTYKYREDVRLLENLEETQLVPVVASAHSFIHISSAFADLMVLSIALKCALPVITDKNADIEEYL